MVYHAPLACPKHLVDAPECAVNALPACWLFSLEQPRSSLPSLTVNSIFGVIALQKASILFGREEELV
jgi:hypothetical protein